MNILNQEDQGWRCLQRDSLELQDLQTALTQTQIQKKGGLHNLLYLIVVIVNVFVCMAMRHPLSHH